ncbi:hypothetical protein E2L08_13975 [Palleronia sediminis]|uniref:DUF1127 domain-containing protein n=1 Tax=Palleronia sediminis TaxID=2547833 RepID=A0A4R6A110_9RHOB|nr:hypothetical protein [Palleronia sediminis]TDL76345.1 hypothetical protein E2L08_13975 [Palleronia sediminis]
MALYDTHRSSAVPLGSRIALRITELFLAVFPRSKPATATRRRKARRVARARLDSRTLNDLGLLRSDLDRL